MNEATIVKDLTQAMKARDVVKVSTLRLLKAAIDNAKIAKQVTELAEPDLLDLVVKEVKKRHEAIEGFQKGKRLDLVEREQQELRILETYRPAPLSDEELMTIVQDAIASTGARTKQEMGQVMKLVMERVRGRAEGQRVSAVVAQRLTG